MIVEGKIFLYKKKYTVGVALSGKKDLSRTDLWRDLLKAPKGQGLKAIISQAKGQSIESCY